MYCSWGWSYGRLCYAEVLGWSVCELLSWCKGTAPLCRICHFVANVNWGDAATSGSQGPHCKCEMNLPYPRPRGVSESKMRHVDSLCFLGDNWCSSRERLWLCVTRSCQHNIAGLQFETIGSIQSDPTNLTMYATRHWKVEIEEVGIPMVWSWYEPEGSPVDAFNFWWGNSSYDIILLYSQALEGTYKYNTELSTGLSQKQKSCRLKQP